MNYPDLHYANFSSENQENNQPQLLYPNLNKPAEEILKQINWDQLPVDNQILVTKLETIVPKVKYALGGACIMSALFLTAPAAIVFGTVVTLGMGSYGCHRIEKKMESDISNNISERKRKRLDVKKEIEDGRGGYFDIRKKRGYGIDIFTDVEFNIIFGHDIAQLYYPCFFEKHGSPCFSILDRTNYDSLKKSFMNYMERDMGLRNISAHMDEFDFFGIKEDDASYTIISCEISRLMNGNITFKNFIERNGFGYMKWIDNNSGQSQFINQMLENYLMELGIGYIDLQNKYPTCHACIESNEFKLALFYSEIEKCRNNVMSYVEFRKRNGFELIADIANIYPEQKNVLISEFSKLQYNDLTASEYNEDRQLFGIGFLERQIILSKRWFDKKIQCVINEDIGFFHSIGNEFTPDEWEFKAVNDTLEMDVSQIAQYFPQLFRSKILKISSRSASGATIGDRLADEIKSIGTFTELVERMPVVLFELRMINANTSGISDLVRTYILQNTYDCMVRDKLYPRDTIEKYSLIPPEVAILYQSAKKSIQEHFKKHEILVSYTKYPNQIELQQNKQNKINLLEQQLEIIKKDMDIKYILDKHMIKINEQESKVAQMMKEKKHNSEQIDKLDEKIKILANTNTGDYKTICEDLRKNELDLKSAQFQIANDKTILVLERKIKEIKNQEIKYVKQNETKKKLDLLKSEELKLVANIKLLREKVTSNDFLKKKEQLIKNLDTSSVMGIVGVLSVARETLLTSKSAELKEMKRDESQLVSDEEKLGKINSEIKEIESVSLDDNADILLSECKRILEELEYELHEYKSQLEIKFQSDKLLSEIQRLKQIKDADEKINDLVKKNEELEKKLSQTNSELFFEKFKTDNINHEYKLAENKFLMAQQEFILNKNRIEQEYNENIHQIEHERKMHISHIEQELRKNIDLILENFRASVYM